MSEENLSLKATLSKLRKRIQRLKERKEKIGEENTKATLIDPLLSALGWDTEELDEVSREYKRKPQDNPVDYALFLLRTPRLFIEAKALEKDLGDRKWVSQMLGYATVVGVEWCILTNGDEYRLYNSHAPVDVEEKLFRIIHISEKDEEDLTLDTLSLISKDKMGENLLSIHWKAHFVDRHIKDALEQIIHSEESSFIRLLKKATNLSASEIKDSLKRADIVVDFPVLPKVIPISSNNEEKKIVKHGKQAPKLIGVSLLEIINDRIISAPFKIEKKYKDCQLEAEVNTDGTITFNNKVYDSPSIAAGFARKSVNNPDYLSDNKWPSTNGWSFWKYSDPESGKLVEIDQLRIKFIERTVKS